MKKASEKKRKLRAWMLLPLLLLLLLFALNRCGPILVEDGKTVVINTELS